MYWPTCRDSLMTQAPGSVCVEGEPPRRPSPVGGSVHFRDPCRALALGKHMVREECLLIQLAGLSSASNDDLKGSWTIFNTEANHVAVNL